MGWRDGSEGEGACCAMCKPGNPSSIPRSNVKVEGENQLHCGTCANHIYTQMRARVCTPHKITNKLLMHLKNDDRQISDRVCVLNSFSKDL